VKQHKLWRHTLFLVGRALRAGGTRSHLYHAGHFHSYRKADPDARKSLREEGAAGGSQPLQASRSGWVAARVSGGWSGHRAAVNGTSDASVAAWSAVRGWQETARAGGRKPRPTEHRRPVSPDQSALELAPQDKPALELAPQPQDKPAQQDRPAQTAPKPKPKPAAKKPAARKTGAKNTGKGNSRKPTSKTE
jgi:hypothetical protein